MKSTSCYEIICFLKSLPRTVLQLFAMFKGNKKHAAMLFPCHYWVEQKIRSVFSVELKDNLVLFQNGFSMYCPFFSIAFNYLLGSYMIPFL